LPFYDTWIVSLALVTPRFMAAFAMLPFLSTQIIPGMLRNGVVLSLCLPLVPLVAPEVQVGQLSGWSLLAVIVKETVVGLLVGYPFALVFWAAESIGSYIDNQRGAAMASSIDPLTGSDSTPLGTMLLQAFATYFVSSGALLVLIGLLYKSYVIWPVTTFFPALGAAGPTFYLQLFDSLMRMVVALSGPVIAAMFLAEFGLALVSRFAPQLNVFFLAMPVKSGLAVLIMIFYVPLLFRNLLQEGGGLAGTWKGIEAILR
jgi:type III secretion protein T